MDLQIKQHVVANEEMLQKSKSVYQHSLDMLEVISECRLLAPSRVRSCTVVGVRKPDSRICAVAPRTRS